MDNQEVFNKVARHLLTQGKRAGEKGDCRYRTDDGLKCAAGCLILDEHYSPKLEGMNAACGPVGTALRLSGAPRGTHPLVEDLQFIHDYAPVEEWRERLRRCAANYDLSAEVVDAP